MILLPGTSPVVPTAGFSQGSTFARVQSWPAVAQTRWFVRGYEDGLACRPFPYEYDDANDIEQRAYECARQFAVFRRRDSRGRPVPGLNPLTIVRSSVFHAHLSLWSTMYRDTRKAA